MVHAEGTENHEHECSIRARGPVVYGVATTLPFSRGLWRGGLLQLASPATASTTRGLRRCALDHRFSTPTARPGVVEFTSIGSQMTNSDPMRLEVLTDTGRLGLIPRCDVVVRAAERLNARFWWTGGKVKASPWSVALLSVEPSSSR